MKTPVGFISMILFLIGMGVASAQTPITCHGVFMPPSQAEGAKGYSPLKYYLDKAREMKDLDRSAPVAMALRGLILTTTYNVEKSLIPLKELKLIHPITRDGAAEKSEQRKQQIQKNFPPSHEKAVLDEGVLSSLMPSKNSMRVIRADNGDYVVFDGNGRLAALQNAFEGQNREVLVEVEVFQSRSSLLQLALHKVRTMRNVLEAP